MSDQTGIGWTDATWNPTTGCTRVSAGCDNCYAVEMTKRLAKYGNENYLGLVNEGKNHFNGVVKCHEKMLLKPLGWKKPRRIFVNSMSDLFHKDVPFEFVDKVFAVMALCPQHQFQVLTKRPERMAEYFQHNGGFMFSELQCEVLDRHFPAEQVEVLCKAGEATCMMDMPGWQARLNRVKDFGVAAPPNVWLGTSVENQEQADLRIPHLLRCPAAVRFLSCEPLLGEVELGKRMYQMSSHERVTDKVCPLTGLGNMLRYPSGVGELSHHGRIHWVIVGGESGPGHREMQMEWLEGIVRQCQAAGVPVFVKQSSGPRPGMQGGIPDRIWSLKEFPQGDKA